MGYHASASGSLTIPAALVDKAYLAAKKVLDSEGADLAEVLGEDGFNGGFNKVGDLDVVSRDYESTGVTDELLDALAPFVAPGGRLNWQGEDYSYWADLFDGKTRRCVSGDVIYDDERPVLGLDGAEALLVAQALKAFLKANGKKAGAPLAQLRQLLKRAQKAALKPQA